MSDKKKKRKKVTRPGTRVRKGIRAVPPREKLDDDLDDDEEGIFTARDYIEAGVGNPFDDDESEDDEKR